MEDEKGKRKEFTDIDELINSVNKHYKKTVIARGRDVKSIIIRRIKTGIFALDEAIGGGFPFGRIVIVQGDFSTGKTTIACNLVREIMKKKEKNEVIYIDLEGTFDKSWAKTLGVNTDKMVFVQPEKSTQGLDIAVETARTGKVGLVVIDSFACISAEAELVTAVDDEARMGVNAQKCNKFIRQIVSALLKQDMTDISKLNECIILILNQYRSTFDKYQPNSSPGGRGKGFASSITIDLRKGDKIAEKMVGLTKKDIVGHEIHFKTTKNKTYHPDLVGAFDFYNRDSDVFNMKKGQVDNNKSIVLSAIDKKIIRDSGAGHFKYDGKKFHGKEKLVAYLESHPEMLKQVEMEVMDAISGNKKEEVKKLLKKGGKK